jgi:hypothetical protein
LVAAFRAAKAFDTVGASERLKTAVTASPTARTSEFRTFAADGPDAIVFCCARTNAWKHQVHATEDRRSFDDEWSNHRALTALHIEWMWTFAALRSLRAVMDAAYEAIPPCVPHVTARR